MAETRTVRLALPRYGAGTDMVSRADFNELVDSLDDNVAVDSQGTDLPTPSGTGVWFTNTESKVMYRYNGTIWDVVGANTLNHVARPTNSSNIGLMVKGQSGQTADILNVRGSSDIAFLRVLGVGDIHTRADRLIIMGNPDVNQHILTLTADDTGIKPMQIIIRDESSKPFVEFKKLTGAVTFQVTHAGVVQAAGIQSASSELTAASAGSTPLVVKATASQTANLIEIKDSLGTVLSSVKADGSLAPRRTHVTSSGSMALDTNNPGLMIGVTTGANLAMNANKIQSRNNSLADTLQMNTDGGDVIVGKHQVSNLIRFQAINITARGVFTATENSLFEKNLEIQDILEVGDHISIQNHNMFFQYDEPEAPQPGDIWFVPQEA